MFSALAPFLIKWYNFSTTQVLVLAAMELFSRGRRQHPTRHLDVTSSVVVTVFTLLLLTLTVLPVCRILRPRLLRLSASGGRCSDSEARASWSATLMSHPNPKSKQGTALGIFAMGNIGITVGMMTVTFRSAAS